MNTEPSPLTNSNRIDQEEDNYKELDIPDEIQQELKEKWNENFNTYRETNIPQQNYETKFHASVTDQEWTQINNIAEHKVQESKNNGRITLWDINVANYVTAITVVGWKGNLREHTKRKES